MNSIQKIFQQRQAFIGYLTAGHRGAQMTQEAALALIEGGVDILEIGVPFSDPIADGPVIQQAMSAALATHSDFTAALEIISNIKRVSSAPIVLFSYYNPLFARGLSQSLNEAAAAGVDALLIVDLPLEESSACYQNCDSLGIAPVNLIAPATPPQRIKAISENCRAFLYYVCRNGTTGIRDALPDNYPQQVETIKRMSSHPVAAGFGIANRQMAAAALSCADGFVVGSRFVKAISEGASAEMLQQLACSIDPRN
ncbi:MAG: tryptophan synthase subunit alpha [Gammaproteobacteria bacterium]|nr:tryptophan synthase subunit alpha [Gammaproteobacteria bacterium]